MVLTLGSLQLIRQLSVLLLKDLDLLLFFERIGFVLFHCIFHLLNFTLQGGYGRILIFLLQFLLIQFSLQGTYSGFLIFMMQCRLIMVSLKLSYFFI